MSTQMTVGRKQRSVETSMEEGHLGTAAEILLTEGEQQAVALLMDSAALPNAVVWVDDNEREDHARLEVHPFLLSRFTEDIRDAILSALKRAARRDDIYLDALDIVPRPAPPDWREQIVKYLGSGPSNQGTKLLASRASYVTEDGLAVRTESELRVYGALKQAQKTHQFLFCPLPAARLPGLDSTFEPDVLVCFKGRCAVLEVDGGAHDGRRSQDIRRDRMFEDAGVRFIEHIDVDDTKDPRKLQSLIDRFLRKLGGA